MRVRRDYGDKNCIGRNVVSLRKEKNIKQKILLAQLQLKGIDIGQSSLSALEGQRREASDRGRCWLSPRSFRCPWSGCSSRLRSESHFRGGGIPPDAAPSVQGRPGFRLTCPLDYGTIGVSCETEEPRTERYAGSRTGTEIC